ncbi:nitrate- and nitrite sensing domain-containing protein [Streptomyces sp. NPDC059740]|uniref:nitrate- and nitrite sensing domain-containing protein n=1 Tax=Streptomyces sp. NPDC059740 TaxID=3346926 RepID=UPI00365BB228
MGHRRCPSREVVGRVRRSTSGPEAPEPRRRGNFTPPSHGTSPGGGEESVTPQGRRGRFSPRNWRVATRLNAIMLIPVLLALVFGGLRVYTSVETWHQAQDAQNTARLVSAAETYAQALISERDVTAQPLLEGHRDDPVVTRARAATDRAAARFDDAVKTMPDTYDLNRRLKKVRATQPELAKLRKVAFTSAMPGVQTEEAYVEVQHPLMGFANELGVGTGELASYGRAVYSVSLAKAAESLYRSIGTHLLVKPAQPLAGKEHKLQLTAFSSYLYLERIAVEEYDTATPPEDASLLKDGEARLEQQAKQEAARTGRRAPDPTAVATAIGSGASPAQLAARGVTPELWSKMTTAKFDLYRQVEKKLTDDALQESTDLVASSRQSAIVDAAIVVAALIIAFVIAGRMARRMSRNMRELRTAAFTVAEQRLPMLVDQLSRSAPGNVDTRVRPIPITTTDEIGEVARAFDQVHREAVRLASEQALLRGNVNAIFTNLSRRSQGLIERQLTLITDLENNEADPDQLENLFRLDHLATRMRRNGENLLILAGEDPGRAWNQPVPLVDVLRASVSEVESYERVELTSVPETEIHGRAVTDLVHLLAELLENATTFSSPHTKVRVVCTWLPDGRVMIEIHDKGIGLTPEDFADINHKLANPPTVDASVSRRMGLFVVGRLAERHGIRVQLRPSGEQAGTTSLVMLSPEITHGGGGEAGREDDSDFTVSRIVPEHRQQDLGAPTAERTAAELGFDDSRYGAQSLDPVERSRQREERRAAVEEPADYRENWSPRPDGAPDAPGTPGFGAPAREEGDGYRGGPVADPFGGREDRMAGLFGGRERPADPTGAGTAGDAGYGGPGHGEPESFSSGPVRAEPGPLDQGFGHGGGLAGQVPPQGPFDDAGLTDRVAFDRPGPEPHDGHPVTDAGLPRRAGGERESAQGWSAFGQPTGHLEGWEHPQGSPDSGVADGAPDDGPSWRTANDDRWQRAEQLRQPKAGGVTASGLPRRVPRANLVEGTAEETPQGGPQVSRAPEAVRGRLSDLRRGVQQGRDSGTESQQNDQQGFGPGTTYDQER